MTIEIQDYAGRKKSVEVDIDKLDVAIKETISGDETLVLINRDGSVRFVDSSNCRLQDYHDGWDLLFHRSSGINKFKPKEAAND